MERASGDRDLDAADRAGSLVADHVRSIIDAAKARARDIEQEAERDAEELRARALEAATSVLSRVDAAQGDLREVLDELRAEADRLTGQAPPASEAIGPGAEPDAHAGRDERG